MRLETLCSLLISRASRPKFIVTTAIVAMVWVRSVAAAQHSPFSVAPTMDRQKSDRWIPRLYGVHADSIAPDSSGMGTLTSVELSQKMIPGWNVGNRLDAIRGETAWGNPLIAQQLIDSVKAAGFHSVRIPIAWSSHFTDTSTYAIDTTWMARVEQVVNYVLKDSMYAIINEHWDGGWQQPTYAGLPLCQSSLINNVEANCHPLP